MRSLEIFVGGLSAFRAAEKLVSAGVEVLSVRRTQKNGVAIGIRARDRKKVFAILRGSCYNVEKAEEHGLLRVRSALIRAAGALVGAFAAVLLVLFLQGRVLRVEVEGSGAYLRGEVCAILEANGVKTLSRPPEKNGLTAEILALPRVGFCSVRTEGGVLRIRVEVAEETADLETGPLLSPAEGRIEALVVVRGTAAVRVGDSVTKGVPVVLPVATVGEAQKAVAVIAWVKVSFPVEREYALPYERAMAQAILDFGEDAELTAEEIEGGWRVAGTGYAAASLNFS